MVTRWHADAGFARYARRPLTTITAAPWGDLFVADDNGRANHIRMLDGAGGVSQTSPATSWNQAWSSPACASAPDGKVLFVNMQGRGMTSPSPAIPRSAERANVGGAAELERGATAATLMLAAPEIVPAWQIRAAPATRAIRGTAGTAAR